jgi:NAD(P)-dependent dehydrogenase (short-subunit alcohol dehydrogenase family)
MAGEFENKVVVITGATGNLGRAVVRRFGSGGAKLVLVDRNMERLQAMCDEFGSNESLPSVTDVGSEEAVEALIKAVEERFGQIDVLAHTVGGFVSGKPVYEAGLDQLEQMWTLNVKPVYIVAGGVARHMLSRNIAGHITVVVARSGLKGSANNGPYTASKAAALRLIESLALEVRDKGIHVNAVSPSIIDTPINRQDMPKADFSKWVKPEQIADAIAFLSSDAGSAFYGTNLEVYARA